jgi:transposase
VVPPVTVTTVVERFGTAQLFVPTTEQSLDFSVACTRQVTGDSNPLYFGAKRLICGVDVSSGRLDAQVGRQGAAKSFSNDPAGISALADYCRQHKVHLLVMEASGGYEQLAFGLLWSMGIEVAIVNARSVRKFAQAMHLFEKTDRIDAGVIAWYGETKKVVATAPNSAQQQQLRALVNRLRQLTDMRAMERNHRRLITDSVVLASLHQVLLLLNGQIRGLEKQIGDLIASDPVWEKLDASFRSIKGVANRTVARLMAQLPEIGVLSNKKISKLVGVAPLADDSGKHKGKRRIYGGRHGVRDILYIIVTCVSRHNKDFSEFKERLSQAGKPKKVIRIALAHKLLIRLNAKARQLRQTLALSAGSASVGA